MNPQTIQLRYTPTPQRPATAWLLVGRDPNEWLRTVTNSRCSHADVRLRVLPASGQDRQLTAALITLGQVAAPGASIAGGLPYGVVAGRLYLPIECRLDPDVTDVELSALLAPTNDYVWSPRTGLVAFEPHEVLRIRDWISLGADRGTSWDVAVPGVGLAARLVAIEPSQAPSFQQIFEDARGDIGSRSDEMADLPRSPAEPSDGLQALLRTMGMASLARVAQYLAGFAPSGASSPTWINAVEAWANSVLGAIQVASQTKRFKELHRLMKLLEENPDEGLKFALPLGGKPHRGIAPPGNRLGQHEVDFRLGAVRGSQAADFWDVPLDLQQRLTARYRDLAVREMRLGRYRRAAYIYAHLLGDFEAAASALRTGHHWREAATLYRTKLNRSLEAANCLDQGGLWSEAIDLYQELGHFEKAGDLHARLGQLDASQAMYRREVQRLVATGARVAAAQLVENKLAAVDEALAILEGGWLHSQQASECLSTLFVTLGRHGMCDRARKWIGDLRQSDRSHRDAMICIETLANNAAGYPDDAIRDVSADACRIVASRVLTDASRGEQARIVAALSRLAPEDRLLVRDGQRFLQRNTPKPPARPLALPAPRTADKIERLHHVRPATELDVRAATWIDEVVYLAGVRADELQIWRVMWDSESSHTAERLPGTWKVPPATTQVLLVADSSGDERLLLHWLGHGPLVSKPGESTFRAGSYFRRNVECGPLPGATEATIAAARSTGGFTCVVNIAFDRADLGGPVIKITGYSAAGAVVLERGIMMDDCPPTGIFPPSGVPRFVLRERAMYLGLGPRLHVFHQDGRQEFVSLPQPVVGVACSSRLTRFRVLAAMTNGVAVFFDQVDDDGFISFGHELQSPVVGFTLAGHVVAVDAGEIQVCRMVDGTLRQHARIEHVSGRPVAFLAGNKPNEFRVINAASEISTYRLT